MAPGSRGSNLTFSLALSWIAAVAPSLVLVWVPLADPAHPATGLREWRDGPRPAFVLTDAAHKRHALTEYRGRAVVVHFFATWCETCRPEMQALERFVAREDNAAFHVVAVSVKEPASRVRRFLDNTPVTFPILLDSDGDVAKAWGVDILPTTYVLDADLEPHLFVDRDLEWDRIELSQILAATKKRGHDDVSQQHRKHKTQGGN